MVHQPTEFKKFTVIGGLEKICWSGEVNLSVSNDFFYIAIKFDYYVSIISIVFGR